MFSIPRPVLDGADPPEHVRLVPRYVLSPHIPIHTLTKTKVNIATYLLLDRAPHAFRPSERSIKVAIALLTFTAVVFRAEVVLLLAPVVLQALWEGYIGLGDVLRVGMLAGCVSLGMCSLIFIVFWLSS
jgi:hypothetical protein